MPLIINNLQLDLDMKIMSELSKIDRFDATWSSIEKREGSTLMQLKSIATNDPEYVELAKEKYYEAHSGDISMMEATMEIRGDPFWIDNHISPAKYQSEFTKNTNSN